MKRTLMIAAMAAAVVMGLSAEDATVEFDWAFVKKGQGDSIVPLDFKERVDIVQGDLFKLFVRPVTTTYVYVLLLDSAGALDIVFPSSFRDFEGSRYVDVAHFIPEGDEWFGLDGERGVETFHLVASAARLRDLESLFEAYRSLRAKSGASAGALGAARQAVLDEIARLRKRYSSLAKAAEKPVTIAGGSRALAQAIQKSATRITGLSFYSRAFRLEH